MLRFHVLCKGVRRLNSFGYYGYFKTRKICIKQNINFTKQRILNRFRPGVTDFNIAGDMEICYRSPALSYVR